MPVTIRYTFVGRRQSHIDSHAAAVARRLIQNGCKPSLPWSLLNQPLECFSPKDLSGYAKDGEKTYSVVALDAIHLFFPHESWEVREIITKLVSWDGQGQLIFSGQSFPASLNWGILEPACGQRFHALFEMLRQAKGHPWMVLWVARALQDFIIEIERSSRHFKDIDLVFNLPSLSEVEPFFTSSTNASIQDASAAFAGPLAIKEGLPYKHESVRFLENPTEAGSQPKTPKPPPVGSSASGYGGSRRVQPPAQIVRTAGQSSGSVRLGSSTAAAVPPTHGPRDRQSGSAVSGPTNARPAHGQGALGNTGRGVLQTALPSASSKPIDTASLPAAEPAPAPSTRQAPPLMPALHASGSRSKHITEAQVLEISEDCSLSRRSIHHGNLYQEAEDRGLTRRKMLSGSSAALTAATFFPDVEERTGGAFRSATVSSGASPRSSAVRQLGGIGGRSATAAADPSVIQDRRVSKQKPPEPFRSYYDAMRPSTKDLTLRALEPPSSPPSVLADDVSSPPPRKVKRKASPSRTSVSSTRHAPPVVPQVMTGNGHPQFGGLTTIKKRPLDTVTNTGKSNKARKSSGRLDDDKAYKH